AAFTGVAIAAHILEERRSSVGAVITPGGIRIKTVDPMGGVVSPAGVTLEGLIAGRGVIVASVGVKRIITGCGIVDSNLVAVERAVAISHVSTPGGIVKQGK